MAGRGIIASLRREIAVGLDYLKASAGVNTQRRSGGNDSTGDLATPCRSVSGVQVRGAWANGCVVHLRLGGIQNSSGGGSSDGPLDGGGLRSVGSVK